MVVHGTHTSEFEEQLVTMAIPGFQSIMVPALRCIEDGEERAIRALIDELAIEFSLSPEDLAQTNEQSGQLKFYNRVHWAITHLFQAGLVTRTGRGKVRITSRGRDAIREASLGIRIDTGYFSRFPAYQEFRARSRRPARKSKISQDEAAPVRDNVVDPSELMEISSKALRVALASELLERIRTMSPRFFERLVLDLLLAMGYGGSREDAAEAVGSSGTEELSALSKKTDWV